MCFNTLKYLKASPRIKYENSVYLFATADTIHNDKLE